MLHSLKITEIVGIVLFTQSLFTDTAFCFQIYMALPQPSQMIKKSGLKITAKVIPALINVVTPSGISRAVLSRGVQVIKSKEN